MNDLFKVLVGTETFDFTELISNKFITVYLEPLEDIIAGDINYGVDSAFEARVSTKAFCEAVEAQQLEIIHSLYVKEEYVTDHRNTGEYNDIKEIRKSLITSNFFKNTILVMKKLDETIVYEPSKIKEKDIILHENAIKQKFLVLSYYFIAKDIHDNRDIQPIFSKIEKGLSLESISDFIEDSYSQLSKMGATYNDTIDVKVLYRILRKKYLDYGRE